MNSTFVDPGFARTGAGHAGELSAMVRPIRPGNVVPGWYSLSSAFAELDSPVVVSAEAAINELPLNRRSRRFTPLVSWDCECGTLPFPRSLLMTAPVLS